MHNNRMKRNEQGFGAVEILILLVIAGLVGVAGWLVYSSQKDTKTSNATQKNDAAQESTNGTTNTSAADESSTSLTPTYSPATLFSDSEKTSLDKMLIRPNIDYAEQYKDKEGYDPLISITVTSKTDAEYATQPDYAKYRYTVKVVSKSGATSDFLYGEKDVIDWWLPECFDGKCGLTDTFKNKYPEIVSKLQAQGSTP